MFTVYHRIVERLTKMGWGEEIAYTPTIYFLREERVVRQSKPLTERGILVYAIRSKQN